MKTIVVLNQQHTLLPQQEQLLLDEFGEWEIYTVPPEGWSASHQQKLAFKFASREFAGDYANIIFASPVPVLLAQTACWVGHGSGQEMSFAPLVGNRLAVYVFHNDRREKKELPNGKVLTVVAQEGWQLIKITC